MTVYFHLMFQVFYGAAGFFLVADDYADARSSGTPAIQLLILSSLVVSATILGREGPGRRIVRDGAPLLGLCGLAFASLAWSIEPSFTFRKAFALLAVMGIALATVVHFGASTSIRMMTQSLIVTCVLSLFAVLAWPEIAIHTAPHEGLWAGVVGHKVSLGMFAGLAIGMLLTHGRLGIRNIPGRIAALAVAATCLVGSGSATGAGVAMTYVGMIRLARAIEGMDARRSKIVIRYIVVLLIGAGYLMSTGIFDKWAWVLGKSGDLTGRSTYWPHVARYVDQYAFYIGFGYAAGYRHVAPIINALSGHNLFEAHNGYIEMLVAFGRIGAGLVVAVLGYYFLAACRLLHAAAAKHAAHATVPFALLMTLFVASYVESVFLMPTGMWTVLLPLAVGLSSKLTPRGTKKAANPGVRSRPVEAYPALTT